MGDKDHKKKKSGPLPGESKIIYQDGDRERYIYGRIVKESDWGIMLKRNNGTYRFAWDKIKRIDEPSTPTVRS